MTGQKAAYDYLGGSIEKFPSGAAMVELIERNGFANAAAEPLTGGIATIYTAEKTRCEQTSRSGDLKSPLLVRRRFQIAAP